MSTSHCTSVNFNEGYRISKQVGDSITTYYWENLQGDIIGILDETGEMVVSYTYDAWGRPLSCTGSMAESVGQKNPFRYRRYYYDAETRLYYLNSSLFFILFIFLYLWYEVFRISHINK